MALWYAEGAVCYAHLADAYRHSEIYVPDFVASKWILRIVLGHRVSTQDYSKSQRRNDIFIGRNMSSL